MNGFWNMLVNRRLLLVIGVFPLLSILMHIHVLNLDLQGIHAWRQCETASNVMRFANEGFPLQDPHVYSLEWEGGLKRMEFPIMQWVMAAAVHAFGHEILMMRLISWVISMFGMWGMYFLARQVFESKWVALLTAWAYLFSPVLFYYSVNPIPDNLALAAGIWGMGLFMHGEKTRKWFWHVLAALAFMFSVLAKLPFVLFLALPATYLFMELFRGGGKSLLLTLGKGVIYILGLLPAASWYLWVIPTWHGNGVVKGILDASSDEWPEIAGIFWHNLISTLPELLLNYGAVLFFLLGLVQLFRKESLRQEMMIPFLSLAAACIAYFVFEINMIGTAHDYYLFPFMPGIFLVVGAGILKWMNLQASWARAVLFILLIALPVLAFIRANPRWHKVGFPEDLILHKAELQAALPADAKVVAGHDLSPHIYLYHLQRQGWTISKDAIDLPKLEKCIEFGATHLVSSHREIDENAGLKPYLGNQVAEIGVFRIIELKKRP